MKYAIKYIAATAVLLVGLFAGTFALFGVPAEGVSWTYAIVFKIVAFCVAWVLVNIARMICPEVWDGFDDDEQVSEQTTENQIK